MAYQQGSFRGVKFRTRKSTTTIGRRVGIYEIPFDEQGAASIDLGRKPRKYRIDALLLGDSAADDRDKLLEALEKSGTGLLVHPSLGSVNVIIGPDIEIGDDDVDAVNQITISFQATEAREPASQTPSLGLGAKGGLLKAAQDLGDAISDAMSTDVSISGVADFVADANIDALDTVLNDLQAVNSDINAVLAIPGNIASQIDSISRELSELLQTPRKVFDAFDGAMDLIAQALRRIAPGGSNDSIGSLERAVSASAALGVTVPDVPTVDTPARARQRQNQGALLINLRANALRHMTKAAADMQFDSSASARRASRKLAAAITSVLTDVIQGQELAPAVRRAMVTMRTAAQQHLAQKAGTLIELTTYAPPETLPAEVAAYVLYGDATRADEIIARNPTIAHPGFIPAEVALEVLVK